MQIFHKKGTEMVNFPQPGYIETPEQFPVSWQREEHKEMLWIWDDIHSPLPSTTLQQSLNRETGRGIGLASRELKVPPGGPRRDFNGYAYIAYLPTEPQQIDIDTHKQRLSEITPGFLNEWNTNYLPEIISNNLKLKEFSVSSNSDSLAADLDQTVKIMQRHYYIHFLVIFTLFGATERFSNHYELITGSTDTVKPYELLQGSSNKSIEASEELYNIAQLIKSNQTLNNIFSQTNIRSIRRALRDHPMGENVDQEIDSYLELFGYRSISEDISSKLWIEDPAYPLMTIRSYVSGPERDFSAELGAKKQLSVENFESLLAQASKNPEINLDDLKSSMNEAKILWPLREDHAYYIDQQSWALTRLVVLKCANELVQKGVIKNSNDIFHLQLNEIKEGLSEDINDFSDIISDRKSAYNQFRQGVPPRFLGKMYEHPPRITGELSKFFNPVANVDVNPVQERNVLRGTAGSPGIHTGPAKVILTPESFDSVQPGDVLVTRTTNPSWAPIFGTIGALVADSGGILSHGAIVARELSLPAVMGTKIGTTLIKTGDLITVDGNTGAVTIV